MCQQIIILAERKGWRYISQCEHGTVHMVWDNIGIHLPAEPFGQLARHMVETHAEFQRQGAPHNGGHCHVQVGRAGLILPLEDFIALIEMLEEATPQINAADERQRCITPRLDFLWSQTRPMLN